MTTRIFGASDLLAFADISGDRNPLHVDPEHARRSMAGAQTMHGVLGVLWALECALDENVRPIALSRLKATFLRPVRAEEVLECETPSAVVGARTRATIAAEGRARFDVEADWTLSRESDGEVPIHGTPLLCREQSLEQSATGSGTLPLYIDVNELARLLPRVAKWLPRRQLAFIVATTRLVGMECPGLHSLYVGLELHFTDASQDPSVHWQVGKVNHQHARLLIDVRSGGMNGTLTVFMRPRAVSQPQLQELATLVSPGEFAGQRVLVVGGSRGLGEVSAKLIAAGGGDVVVTYRFGETDALRIVDEIRGSGATAKAIHLDVRDPNLDALGDWEPTEMHYFASPRIDFGRAGTFSPQLFRRLCGYYVDGFAAVRASLRTKFCSMLRVLYASSEAVESVEPGAEYAAAKAAGEVVCAQLARHFRDTLHTPRFPRMRTDQTASVLILPSADPGPFVLAALRHLRAI